MTPSRIPGVFPISPKWRFILFGLGTIQYAKHPEGVIEMSKARISRTAGEEGGQGARRRHRRSRPSAGEPASIEESVS